MNNTQVAHLWANKSRPSAKGSSFYFEGDTIYSYGPHFPIARHVNGVVLFTTGSYSVTTARHISITRQACSHLDVFHVENPRLDPSGKDVKGYAERIKQASLRAARARNPEIAIDDLERLVCEANNFCARFGFKARFAMPAGDQFEALKLKAKEAAQREKVERARVAEKQKQEEARAIAEWLAGERSSLPYSVGRVFLRVKHLDIDGGELKEGSATTWTRQLETSKGACVPLADAEKAFRFITRHRESGWHRNGDTFQVGEFQLDAVNAQGIVAGCHRIDWEEIERFAKVQGWI